MLSQEEQPHNEGDQPHTPDFDQEIEVNWAWLITVRNRKAVRVETFTDKAQALEAAMPRE